MRIHGIYQVVTVCGVLLLLYIGTADLSSKSSESTTSQRHDVYNWASAILSSTHLLYKETQSPEAAVYSQNKELKNEPHRTIEYSKIESVEEALLELKHLKSPSDLRDDLSLKESNKDYATVATNTLRQHVAETDIRAAFGTSSSVEILSNNDAKSNFAATTPSSPREKSKNHVTEKNILENFGTALDVGSLIQDAQVEATQSPESLTPRDHVTETNIRENFGTAWGVDAQTEIDAKAESKTTRAFESTVVSNFLTESVTEAPTAFTTEKPALATQGGATALPSGVESLTETATKAVTAVSEPHRFLSESSEKDAVGFTTAHPLQNDHITVASAAYTDRLAYDSDHGPQHIVTAVNELATEGAVEGVDEETTTSDELKTSLVRDHVIAAATNAPQLDENKTYYQNDHDDESNSKSEIIYSSQVATKRPTLDDADSHVVPVASQYVVTLSSDNGVDDVHDRSRLHESVNELTTQPDDTVTVASISTGDLSTKQSTVMSAPPKSKTFSERYRVDPLPTEILVEKEAELFRCLDGTVIGLDSVCDQKGDCPDFSDEDMCDPEEKASEASLVSRPSSNWDQKSVSMSTIDKNNLQLVDDSDNKNPPLVEEITVSYTEKPNTFTCAESRTVIPIAAVCDKRADCEDYSDEYDCDDSKQVTEAPLNTERPNEIKTAKFEIRSNMVQTPSVELLDESEEEPEVFRCLDGSALIPMKAVCDKKWDCFDFSDEDECDSKGNLDISKPARTKPSMSWATAEQKIIPSREAVSIIEEIPDEKGSLPEFWQCENGNFIYILSVCDKKDDCGDFSDEDDCVGNRKVPTTEEPPTDPPVTFSSRNESLSGTLAVTTPEAMTVPSTAVSLTVFPDSKDDRWSKEMTTPKTDFLVAKFTCADGELIEAIFACDGKIDCFDGSDEDNCYNGWDNGPMLRFEREVGSGDINECALNSSLCTGVNEECVDTVSSYSCSCINGTSLFAGFCLYSQTITGLTTLAGYTFTAALEDPNSPEYANISSIVCNAILSAISNLGITDPVDCQVLSLANGSIIATFALTIYNQNSTGATDDTAMVFSNLASSLSSSQLLTSFAFNNPGNATCTNNTCQNNSTCRIDYITDVSYCVCLPGYGGDFCENKTACIGYNCTNGGVCEVDALGNPYCSCPPDFDGTFCEVSLACPSANFQCNDLSCISNSAVCNGVDDCLTAEDESNTYCADACPFPTLNDRVILAVTSTAQARYRAGATINLDCIIGSTIIGNGTIVCVNGSFTTGPQCLRDCHLDSGRNALTCTSYDITHGTNPDCSCASGYELEVALASITCNDSQILPSHPQCAEINECLLPVTPCDTNAACFNMPLGSFTCICNAGFSGNGMNCTDIDECALGLDNCDPDATCMNIAGSFTCACNSGYVGDGVTSCILPIYYPYGLAANDSSIKTSQGSSVVQGYVVSGPIQRRTLFPLGSDLYRYIFITNTGVVVFSNILSVDLSEFSHPTTFTNVASTGMCAIAVFGIEASSAPVDSSVYYQVYEESDFALLDNVSSVVNSANVNLTTTFVATWALVITWENLRRFGDSSTSRQTNTFQAVLATDGVQGIVLQYYEESAMLWDAGQIPPEETPVIGYRSNIEFYDLQSANGYTRDQIFRPDALEGSIPVASPIVRRRKRATTYELGRFVFRLDNNPADFVNPAEFCQSWHDIDAGILPFEPGVLPCPCTRTQAMNDRRFKACVSYPDGVGLPAVDPYPASLVNSDSCVQQVFPGRGRAGSRCIYSRNDSLVVGYNTLWESSHIQSYLVTSRSPQSYQYTVWANDDVLPRYYCCSQSSDSYFCDLYESRRPVRSCLNYKPVGQGWGIGDPHITTLDSFQYTFNGLGEYTLVRIDSIGFELQGRTEKAIDANGTLVNTGTVFTAFAAEYGATKIEFILHNNRGNLTILVNGTDLVDAEGLKTTDYESADPAFDLRFAVNGLQTTGSRYVSTWREGFNDFSVIVGFQLGMLDFSFQAPADYQDGRTTGLYGIWNGDVMDDVVSPDGTVNSMPFNLTEEQLFNLGELWKVTNTTTLFTYLQSNTYATFNGASFTPMFLSTLLGTADSAFLARAQMNCSMDTSCLFDALATNDIAIGTNTMMTSQTREQEVQELGNFPPILSNVTEINPDPTYPGIDGATGILTLIVGRSYMFQAEATDANGDVVEYSLQGNVPGNATIDPLTGIITYTPGDTSPVDIGVLASDGTASRFLQLLIVLCYCANNGTCDFSSYVMGSDLRNDKYAVAQCDCAQGWSGQTCSNDYDSCALNPCYPGVTCIDLPPPSLEPMCADCPPSLTGDGFQCWDLDECAVNLDGCQQNCINMVGTYSCSCNSGYELQPDLRNCIDIDECERGTDMCDVNGVCNNTIGSYFCTCNDGYMLLASDNTTCEDTDECSTIMPCDVNADCENIVGSYTCTCRSGYQGTGRVCSDINECFNPTLNDCSLFATCTNVEGYYVCNCLTGYQGSGVNCTDRNECLEGLSGCSANAMCMNLPGSFVCECNVGYMGDGINCIDVDECSDSSLNDCYMNALCTNNVGSYTCTCNSGFSGNGTYCADINECLASPGPCSTFATCTNNVGSYDCTCDAGYNGNGLTCADVDECALGTDNCEQICTNESPGFTCSCSPGFQLTSDNATCEVAPGMVCASGSDPCTGGGLCSNATGLITCTCPSGYNNTTPTNCEDNNECALMTDSCDPAVGICTNLPGTYLCLCQDGYQLESDQRSCGDINECETGANNCSADATCTNTAGGFTCSCNSGYVGDGVNCTDINECANLPCVSNADCTNTVGSYMCTCSAGYIGDQMRGCTDLNECLSMPCDANAICTNLVGSYNCSCSSGFSGNGTFCQDIKECANPSSCPANSDCQEFQGSYTCICRSGYRGDGSTDCVDIDECAESLDNCDANAKCLNTPGSYVCSCNGGYEGNGFNCSDINECVTGATDCDVNSNCTNLDGSYTCFCIEGYFDSGGGRARPGDCLDVDECSLQIDQCDAYSDCVNTNGSYTCVCKDGFMMDSQFTCVDILECATDPCAADSLTVCMELIGSYECVCQSSTTLVNGTCKEATTLFLTVPFVDIKGLVVEFFYSTINNVLTLDELANDTATILKQSANFTNLMSVTVERISLSTDGAVADVTFRVDIPFSTTIMESALVAALNNGLTGTNGDILAPDSRIYIVPGIGQNVDVNECSNVTICPTNSLCINTIGSYRCQCDTGYSFLDNTNTTCSDINECDVSNGCGNFSTCNNTVGSYQCTCLSGYAGSPPSVPCEFINKCANGSFCGPYSDCVTENGTNTCSCQSGFTGTPPTVQCQDINECDLNYCSQNANCTNSVGSYSCECNSGFSGNGTVCNDINECVATPGICTGMNEECVNAVGSYDCNCILSTTRFLGSCLYRQTLSGIATLVGYIFTPELEDPSSPEFANFTGIVCGVLLSGIENILPGNASGYIHCDVSMLANGSVSATFSLDIFDNTDMGAMNLTGMIFTNLDNAVSTWRGPNGQMVSNFAFDDPGNATCTNNTCQNNSTCMIDYSADTSVCVCLAGYGGDFCENETACIGHDCLNGGVCEVDTIGNPYCRCPQVYTGPFCEDIAECLTLGCLNNSTCELDEDLSAFCNCTEGYTSTRCEREVTTGLPTGAIVGIILGSVGFVLLVVLCCFCCWAVIAAHRRRQVKRALYETEDNYGYDGRRRYHTPGPHFAPSPALGVSGVSRGAVVRNDLNVLSDGSSDNFYTYRNVRPGQFASGPPRSRVVDFDDDDDDDDTIDGRFSGIMKNMWNMHADQRPATSFDPRELPASSSNFLACGGIPRASVQSTTRNAFARTDYPHGFERPYVADGTESSFSDETEELRAYRGGRQARSRGFEPYNYF